MLRLSLEVLLAAVRRRRNRYSNAGAMVSNKTLGGQRSAANSTANDVGTPDMVPDARAQAQLIADLSGLLARHLNALPVNYHEFEDWRTLCDDTVKILTRHNLLPLARAAAERQCGARLH